MDKFAVVKAIMESDRISDSDKLDYIRMALDGWSSDALRWIWE